MNYKKLIPNQNFRLKLLKATEIIPDLPMIYLQYFIKTGRWLNLKNPKRFNEMIQRYKLYYRDDKMTICADKYAVRSYIKQKGLEEILIPIYGVYEDASEIDFKNLPQKFVLKTNNGSGTNILCKDKNKINIQQTRDILNEWLYKRTAKAGREWAYYNISPKIICEKFLESEQELIDYKFYCFHGKPKYIKVAVIDKEKDEVQNSFYDINFEELPYRRKGIPNLSFTVNKPENYSLMLDVCETLSSDFPHVRIDLYNVGGKIFFGESTFYDTSGYEELEPDELDYILGREFNYS